MCVDWPVEIEAIGSAMNNNMRVACGGRRAKKASKSVGNAVGSVGQQPAGRRDAIPAGTR